MFTSKTYEVACPVCRQPHQIEAEFFSSPRSILATDGRVLPSESCGNHTAEELQAAWSKRHMHIPSAFSRCEICGEFGVYNASVTPA